MSFRITFTIAAFGKMVSIDECQSESEEFSLEDVLTTLLTDDTLSDILLQGNDGEKVAANRCILACRSDVFKRMLFNTSSSGTSHDILRVNYDGDVVQALVDYIYTDDADILTAAAESMSCNAALAKTLVFLTDAALHFGLPGLVRKTEEVGCQLMEENNHLACSFMETCRNIGSRLNSSCLLEKALQIIRANPTSILNNEGLASLGSAVLEEIVSDNDIEADELSLFYLIKAWYDSYCNSIMKPDNMRKESRRTVAAKLAEHIRYENIDPNLLTSAVSSSGLVPEKRLNEAYKAQALRAVSRNGETSYGRSRYQSSIV